MSDPVTLEPARRSLDDFEQALAKLDAGCCDPGRSPRMRALAEALGASRLALERVGGAPESADDAIAALEDMGAQIGRLQVGCCTEKRMPLYARMLVDLTDAQIAINRAAGQGH
jgi:hypothetical protein